MLVHLIGPVFDLLQSLFPTYIVHENCCIGCAEIGGVDRVEGFLTGSVPDFEFHWDVSLGIRVKFFDIFVVVCWDLDCFVVFGF